MNRTACFALVMLIFSFTETVHAESLAEIFQRGVSDLRKKECSSAAKKFDRLQNLSISDPNLFFNKGLAFECLNQHGKAILYFERAKTLAPTDKETTKHIRAVYKRLGERHATTAPNREFDYHPPLTRVVTGWISLKHASYATLVLNLFAWLSIAYLLWGKNENKRVAAGLSTVVFAFATAFFLVICLSKSHLLFGKPTAVVLRDHLSLKESPGTDSESNNEAFEGEQASVNDRRNGYVFLSFSEGRKGWVPRDTIGTY
ncbi:MAG: tetratricopeptide repeat protein [Myxococcales bacterium]|nr:MAG: tetratricopeptide repeat protein [Myxococcales bacterium]